MMAQFPKFIAYIKAFKQYVGEIFHLTTRQQPLPKPEPIKHLLIGSPKAVTSTIHYLQVIGYAQVGDWSPLQPTDNPGEVVSILTRQILTQ